MPALSKTTAVILAVAGAGGGALGVGGCSREEPSAAALDVAISVLANRPMTSEDSVMLGREIARVLAVALQSPSLREELSQVLSRSTVREHKTHLQRFLASRGARFGSDVATLSGLAPDAWVAAANRLSGLEVYLPVPAHRDAWTGGADLVVPTQ